MKYLSSKSVADAYKNFQNSMTNKSWGYLALLKECNEVIKPCKPYEINLNNVSNFLEGLFNLEGTKKTFNGGKSLYVVFSKQWKDYFKTQGTQTPNIYDVAVWAFRRNAFEDSADIDKLLSMFAATFNISNDILESCFNTSLREISFVDNLYSEAGLKQNLQINGVDVSKNNIDAQCKSVVANPGETSRGPFVQPLYAGLDITDYVLILQSNYFDIYGSDKRSYKPSVALKDVKSHTSYFAALRTKPFMLLAGISGTGKSRIVRKFAQASVTEGLQKLYDPKSVEKGFNRWELHKPANFELVQVKPNWHNSLEVVGYKSNIGGAHYEFTSFVEFVVRAWKHQDVPFFLCLDEMNLAPVEQYFAEFLSAIESRSMENGEYETDPIIKPFKEFGDKVCDDMLDHLIGKIGASKAIPDSLEGKLVERFKNKGLTLPQNLLVLGTVNMDETTFSFSRKVLDRAMSVVMNEVELDKFFKGETENDMAEMTDANKKDLIDRPIRGLDAANNDLDAVKEYLKAINGILEDTPFKLGYRAANEALLYVSAANTFNAAIDTKTALDEFTMMKILSRIEGDKRSIDNLLEELQKVITADYPKSHEKLEKMAETLKNKQFVSYWT